MLTPKDISNTLVQEAGEAPITGGARAIESQAGHDLRAAAFDAKTEREKASTVIAGLIGEAMRASDWPEPTARVTGPVPLVRKSTFEPAPLGNRARRQYGGGVGDASKTRDAGGYKETPVQ
jgi:hypothetical protein